MHLYIYLVSPASSLIFDSGWTMEPDWDKRLKEEERVENTKRAQQHKGQSEADNSTATAAARPNSQKSDSNIFRIGNTMQDRLKAASFREFTREPNKPRLRKCPTSEKRNHTCSLRKGHQNIVTEKSLSSNDHSGSGFGESSHASTNKSREVYNYSTAADLNKMASVLTQVKRCNRYRYLASVGDNIIADYAEPKKVYNLATNVDDQIRFVSLSDKKALKKSAGAELASAGNLRAKYSMGTDTSGIGNEHTGYSIRENTKDKRYNDEGRDGDQFDNRFTKDDKWVKEYGHGNSPIVVDEHGKQIVDQKDAGRKKKNSTGIENSGRPIACSKYSKETEKPFEFHRQPNKMDDYNGWCFNHGLKAADAKMREKQKDTKCWRYEEDHLYLPIVFSWDRMKTTAGLPQIKVASRDICGS